MDSMQFRTLIATLVLNKNESLNQVASSLATGTAPDPERNEKILQNAVKQSYLIADALIKHQN